MNIHKHIWISLGCALGIAASLMLALPALLGLAAPLRPGAGGCALSPGQEREASAGTVVTYTHVLTNTGDVTNTFQIIATNSHGWPLDILGDPYPGGTSILKPLRLRPEMTATCGVRVTVPHTASAGTVNTTTVTATSLSSPTVQAVAHNVTTLSRRRIYLPLLLKKHPLRWALAENTAGMSFYALATCPGNPQVQYAGTAAHGLFRSEDGGQSWTQVAFEDKLINAVVARAEAGDLCGAYATVWGEGLYHVSAQGVPSAVDEGVGALTLVYALALSPDGQTLYAGTNSAGVYKTAVDTIDWTPIGTYADDDARRIRSLYVIDGELYAGSRACTFYRFDAQDTAVPEVVLTDGCADAQVWAIAKFDGRLYASLGDKGLYSRPDSGTWQGGAWPRVTGVPAMMVLLSGLWPYGEQLYVGTYGEGLYTCASDAVCAPLPAPSLGNAYIRGLALVELDAEAYLMAATDDGIWRLEVTPE